MKSRLIKKGYIKRALIIILVVILGVFVFDLYKYQHEKNKFNIVLTYGVEGEDVNLILFKYNRKPKNVLNTLNDTFVKDLVLKGKSKTKLVLTENEMKDQVKNLDQLHFRIEEIIRNKEEFKKLPDSEGGYM